MSDPAEMERLQARHDREHQRRCALETFIARLALLVGQDTIDRAWGEMEERHGKQEGVVTRYEVRPPKTEEATE